MTGADVLDSPGYRAVQRHISYVLERRPKSWFWKRWQVRPSGATGVVFTGTWYQCAIVQQQMLNASRNGAWVALNPSYHS